MKDNFWAIYIPLFLFTSPALVYYTNNFLADAPALGMALTGTFLFYKYAEDRKKRWLFLAIACTTLAGLLKISSLILFTAFLSLTLLHLAKGLIQTKETFKSIIQKLLPFLVVILIIFIWYRYAEFYNSRHNSHGIFLQKIFPIWAIDAKKQHDIWTSLYFQLLPSFFNKKALALLFILMVTAIVISFKKNKELVYLYLITFLGIFLFMILWFQALDVHDYYLTNLLIIIPFSSILFLSALKISYTPIFKHWVLKAVALMGISVLVYQTTLINRMKYNAEDPYLNANVFLKKQEIDYWKYVHFQYGKTKKALETITPYLRSLGIERNDLVYSTPDISINHTLYLMDQRGFTDYNYGHLQGPEKLNERIAFMVSIGAKYLIINDPEILVNIDAQYLSTKIGEYENVLIYKLLN